MLMYWTIWQKHSQIRDTTGLRVQTQHIVVSQETNTDDIYLCQDPNHKSFKLIRELVFIESVMTQSAKTITGCHSH